MNTTQAPDIDHLRTRVRLYFQVILAIDVLAYVSDVIGPALFGTQPAPVVPVRWFVTGVLVTSWVISRFGRASRGVIVFLEGAVTITLSFAYVRAGETYLDGALEPSSAAVIVALGIVLLLVVRASLIPSPVTRTAVVGTMAFAVLVVATYREFEGAEPVIIEALLFMGVAFVIATSVTSHVIYGLRVEVRRALRLGQYELGERLGAGGMGAVYRASHAMLRRDAAIKLIRPELVGGDDGRRAQVFQRFEREAQVTAHLESPHTVQLYDFGVSPDGAFYYVMELLDGVDLHGLVERFGPIEPGRAVHILRQVCDSLEEAHQTGLVHRDIKPGNILLCRYGIRYDFAKVLDFGLVLVDPAVENGSDKLTADGLVAGTPAFLAPEMASGEVEVDSRADLYSLGCVAYWLLTGHCVFEKSTPMAMAIAHVTEQPAPPSSRTEIPIPPALERVIMSCLAKSPDERPASAQALAEALAQAVAADAWTAADALEWWRFHAPQLRPSPVDAAIADAAIGDAVAGDGADDPGFVTTAHA